MKTYTFNRTPFVVPACAGMTGFSFSLYHLW
ncbi:hypothetical protein CbuK_0284 [Coxiella burnetii CbuK_Q154]|nr:hypothetical protein CbuK_0284 [Coxiella burnetii CbuK_Q154]